jgi:hypothetical protein
MTEEETLSAELTAACDALNNELEMAETGLSALGLCLGVEVPLFPSHHHGPQIGFGKIGNAGGWVLYYRSEMSSEKSRLVSVSRSIRLQAATRLPYLLDRMLVISRSMLVDVQYATGLVREFNERMLKRMSD